ncbi:MAG: hypothetical protein KDB27_21490 [Planctomycetales bacterium]|nr:hypothetical protein [Planctomycetales bacterium]
MSRFKWLVPRRSDALAFAWVFCAVLCCVESMRILSQVEPTNVLAATVIGFLVFANIWLVAGDCSLPRGLVGNLAVSMFVPTGIALSVYFLRDNHAVAKIYFSEFEFPRVERLVYYSLVNRVCVLGAVAVIALLVRACTRKRLTFRTVPRRTTHSLRDVFLVTTLVAVTTFFARKVVLSEAKDPATFAFAFGTVETVATLVMLIPVLIGADWKWRFQLPLMIGWLIAVAAAFLGIAKITNESLHTIGSVVTTIGLSAIAFVNLAQWYGARFVAVPKSPATTSSEGVECPSSQTSFLHTVRLLITIVVALVVSVAFLNCFVDVETAVTSTDRPFARGRQASLISRFVGLTPASCGDSVYFSQTSKVPISIWAPGSVYLDYSDFPPELLALLISSNDPLIVNISTNSITADQIRPLSGRSLTHISLSCQSLDPDALRILVSETTLLSLSIDGPDLAAEHLEILASGPSSVHVGHDTTFVVNNENVSLLESVPFQIYNVSIQIEDDVELDLSPLWRVFNLTITSSHISKELAMSIDSLPAIKTLRFVDCHIDDDALAVLSNSKHSVQILPE